MDQHYGSSLPKDKNVERIVHEERNGREASIEKVSDYIQRVSDYIEARKEDRHFFVYRGEPELYPSPCRPGLFRMSTLTENPFFEKTSFTPCGKTSSPETGAIWRTPSTPSTGNSPAACWM